jgi:2-oxoglutarate dehydrogenase E2 component (dihydrolipoamide succinyltransferase)
MAVELKIPSIGESVTEVTISQWIKADGDYVDMDEVVAELESEKATVELNAPEAGQIKILAEEGSDVSVGSLVATIDVSVKKPKDKENPKPAVPTENKTLDTQESKSETNDKVTYAKGVPSPSAKKLISEEKLSSADIRGTGKDGRITKGDVLKTMAFVQKSGGREVRRQKMSNLRKAVGRRLVAAKNETAMLTTFNEVNMDPIMEIRKQYKEKFKESHDIGLGFMSFFMRASVLALQKYPSVNAYIDGEEVIFHDFTDISIAVSGPKGLMVPVIRNAEGLSMAAIEKEVYRLAIKARDGKLSINEMTGGTFTISNGGVFGSMMSTPIINPPQSAILGMHNIIQRPIVENGDIVAKPMMYLALSYDHRIIDGKESVGFLLMIKNLLENPASLLGGSDPIKTLLDL